MTSPRPLSVVHIAAPAHVGGLERVVQGLSIGLRGRGHSVRVLAMLEPETDPTPFAGRMQDADVDVRVLEVPARRYLLERRLIREQLMECRPDVVHTHGYRPDVLDAGIARSLSIPTVTTVHGASFMGGLSAVYEWLQERSYRRFDRVVSVSSALAERLWDIGVAEEKVVVIRNAWEGSDQFLLRDRARDELDLARQAWVVGWVGRMIQVKGGDLFLRALSTLRGDEWMAVMIGDGPMRESWGELATELGLDANVVFPGAISDARRLYRAFDAFVLSSSSEGMPVVLFEAMGAEVPIIATRVGGVPEVLDDSTGYLVPPEDPERLRDALQRVREEPEEARKRSLQARRRLDADFSMEGWVSEHERLYRDLTRCS